MTLNTLANAAHKMAKSKGFWDGYRGFDDYPYEAMKVALISAEVSEALEALRSNDGSRGNFGEELADIVIRVGDLAGATGVDLDAEVAAKFKANSARSHKHGKRF